MSPGGNSSLQASANVTSDGPVSVLAGTHYVAARPAVLQFRETAMLAFRETAIDAPAYAAAGSATLSVAGTLYIRHQDGLVVAGEPGAALPGNAIAGSPYGQAVFAAGVLRSPAATFSDASRVSIGTLDLRDTSTQLTFDNTQPYNAATGQGVQLGQLLFGGGNALTIAGNGGFGFQGGITVLGPNAAYQGPALSANGGQLSFLLPADAVNGTTMLRASAPIATQGATVAMQAAGPLKRLLPGDRIMLISATTGTVANPGSHILEYGAYRYLFDVQSASALTATLASTNLTLAANKLYPRSIGAGIGALADSGGMLSAADLRGPERRGLFFSPDLGHTRYTDKNLKLDRANAVFGYALGGATAAGDYVVAPLVEAGRTAIAARLRRAACRPRARAASTTSAWASWRATGSWAARMPRPAAQRTHARQLYRRHRRQHQLPQSFELLGAHAMLGHVMPLSERGQLDAYARLQWQRLGGDSVRNDAGDQLSYDATQALRTRLGARYVYAAGDQTRLYAGAAWEQDARTEARGSMARPCRARTPMAARRCWKRRALGAIAVLVAAPERARPVRGQAGIGERLSSIGASEAGRRQRSGRQMGLDRLQDLHHVFAAKLRHEGRGPGRISLDQPRDSALTPLTSSRISAGNAAASGSVSGVSRDGKRSVMERDGRGWTPGIIRHPRLIIPRGYLR